MEDLENKIKEQLNNNSEFHYDDYIDNIHVSIIINSDYNNCDLCIYLFDINIDLNSSKPIIKFKYETIKDACRIIKDIKHDYMWIDGNFEKKTCEAVLYLMYNDECNINDVEEILDNYLIKQDIYLKREYFEIKTNIKITRSIEGYIMIIFDENNSVLFKELFEDLTDLIKFYQNIEYNCELTKVGNNNIIHKIISQVD